MEFSQEIVLDLNSNNAYTTVGAKQGDSGSRIIKVNLTQNGLAYLIPAGSVAYFRLRKPDGKAIANNVTIQDNQIYIALTALALAVAGRAYGDITLLSGSLILSTVSFILVIMAAPSIANEMQSSSEFGYLNLVVSDAINVIYESEAWAIGQRGGVNVPSEESNTYSFILNQHILSVSVNFITFKEKVGLSPGITRKYKFIYTQSLWKLYYTCINGSTITEADPELVISLLPYGITYLTYSGGTELADNDWIEVIITEKDNTYNNNSKYYALQAASSKQAIDNLTVSAETVADVEHGGQALVIKTISQGVANFHFKIPKGDYGDVNFMTFDIDTSTGELIMKKPDQVNPLINFSLNNNDGNLYFDIQNGGNS